MKCGSEERDRSNDAEAPWGSALACPLFFRSLLVEGGFVEVLGDVVTVLTQRAVPAAEIDAAVAREQLQSAQSRRAATAEAVAVRDRAVAQARAQLRVARPDVAGKSPALQESHFPIG